MNTFETSATVEAGGRVLVAGVPFAPGTEVEVTVCPVQNGATASDKRVEQLLAALGKSRNVDPITAFSREELYDRRVLR